jgi:hypothetical protein
MTQDYADLYMEIAGVSVATQTALDNIDEGRAIA